MRFTLVSSAWISFFSLSPQPKISCNSNSTAALHPEEPTLTNALWLLNWELELTAFFSDICLYIRERAQREREANSALAASGRSVLTLVEMHSLPPELTVPFIAAFEVVGLVSTSTSWLHLSHFRLRAAVPRTPAMLAVREVPPVLL